jgi:hypothetical protein
MAHVCQGQLTTARHGYRSATINTVFTPAKMQQNVNAFHVSVASAPDVLCLLAAIEVSIELLGYHATGATGVILPISQTEMNQGSYSLVREP